MSLVYFVEDLNTGYFVIKLEYVYIKIVFADIKEQIHTILYNR